MNCHTPALISTHLRNKNIPRLVLKYFCSIISHFPKFIIYKKNKSKNILNNFHTLHIPLRLFRVLANDPLSITQTAVTSMQGKYLVKGRTITHLHSHRIIFFEEFLFGILYPIKNFIR